jgi:predicted acetyltransferase
MELPLVDRVTLTPVPESQRHIITNLMQLYKYDFSEFAEVGSRYGEVGPDGRFTYEGLDSYWREDGLVPLTVEADGRLAGFVLVNRWSALNRLLDHSVGEFFVLRKYRRIGVGSRAARVLFERWPGRCRALGGSCGLVQQAGSIFLEKGYSCIGRRHCGGIRRGFRAPGRNGAVL